MLLSETSQSMCAIDGIPTGHGKTPRATATNKRTNHFVQLKESGQKQSKSKNKIKKNTNQNKK